MAFTGTPTVKKISDNCWRIGGVSLAALATGTIGFSDKTIAAEASIVAPDWQPYEIVQDGTMRDATGTFWVRRSNGQRADPFAISLAEMVQVTVRATADVTSLIPISVVKTGTTHADFQIAIHNLDVLQLFGPLEIYVRRDT